MLLQTNQGAWQKLNQASLNKAAGLTNSENTLALLDGATAPGYTTAKSFQNPAHWPAKGLIVQVPLYYANAARIRFAVADTADDTITGSLWGKDANGVCSRLVSFSTIQAGLSTLTVDPDSGATLMGFFCADNLVLASGTYIGDAKVYNVANGWSECRLDLLGVSELFFDFDCDATGTAGTDGICWVKFY